MALANAATLSRLRRARFNRDTPYDQFLCEQLAGDLPPPADEATNYERLTATVFWSWG